MYDTMKNKAIGEAEVIERFGVPPSKVVEVQALIGDSSDNVPGVPGIGVKTAALLINEFGDLETLLARASEIKQDKRRENLIKFADQARLSQDARHPRHAMCRSRCALAETAVRQPDAEALGQLHAQARIHHAAPPRGRRTWRAELPEGMTPSTTPQRKKKDDYDHPLRRSPRGEAAPAAPSRSRGTPRRSSRSSARRARSDPLRPRQLRDGDRRPRGSPTARRRALSGPFRLQGEAQFRRSDAGRVGGVALALVPGHAAYVPLAHRASDGLDLSGDTIAQIPMRAALDLLKPILEDASVLKIVQNTKFDMVALARYGIALDTIDDPCLMSYALDAGRAEHLPEQLAGSLLGHTCLTEKEVVGTGRRAVSFDRVRVAARHRICRRGDRYRRSGSGSCSSRGSRPNR